jgi:hypothetical protein
MAQKARVIKKDMTEAIAGARVSVLHPMVIDSERQNTTITCGRALRSAARAHRQDAQWHWQAAGA